MQPKQTYDYLEIKIQYNAPGRPVIIQNPLMQSPTTERKSEYRLNVSSFGTLLMRIIAERHNNAKIMKITKYIQLSILFIRNIVKPKTGKRIPPNKPIIEISKIIIFFRICLLFIYFYNLFRFINIFGRLSVIETTSQMEILWLIKGK